MKVLEKIQKVIHFYKNLRLRSRKKLKNIESQKKTSLKSLIQKLKFKIRKKFVLIAIIKRISAYYLTTKRLSLSIWITI